MRGVLYKGLALFFGLALCVSVAAWLRSRHDLREEADSNVSLRATLGELTIAIAARDREIDRMAQLPCGAKEK